MADYRCKFCGYFLCSSELKTGSVRLVCRRCKAGQTVKFGARSIEHHQFGELTTSQR